MRVISVLDTSIANYNLGNEIIMDSVYKHLNEIFSGDFFFKLPVNDIYENSIAFINNSNLVFLGGTNALSGDMEAYSQIGFTKENSKKLNRKIILMGLGWWQYQDLITPYTAGLLNRILSKEHLLSLRDSYTLNKLKSLGFSNLLLTGCPTLWNLTPELISRIPKTVSSENAIVTVTDYCKRHKDDKSFIETVRKHYKYITFWPQGVGDYDYLTKELSLKDIDILPPTLSAYDSFLEKNKPDYIGTRLHGGIRALQKQCRAVIIANDNRAAEMGKDFSLPVTSYALLNSDIKRTFPEITIPANSIRKWKKQFLDTEYDDIQNKIPSIEIQSSIIHKTKRGMKKILKKVMPLTFFIKHNKTDLR